MCKQLSKFPNLFVSGEFRRNIYLTVKEALHNIVKHSQATDVKVNVETSKELFISIHDNGIGFDEKNIRPFSNGLSNMRKRIESLGWQPGNKKHAGKYCYHYRSTTLTYVILYTKIVKVTFINA